MGGTYRQKDKCIYNGMVYKKKKYISKLFYCLFQVSISFEADLDDQLNSCICCTHLLNGVESFSTPGFHVAWSLKLQLVGHWEYSRKHQAFYPATQMPLDFLFVSLVTGLSGDKYVPWFSTPSTFWIFSMNINAVVLEKRKAKNKNYFKHSFVNQCISFSYKSVPVHKIITISIARFLLSLYLFLAITITSRTL